MSNVTEDITVYTVYISNEYLKDTKIEIIDDKVWGFSAIDCSFYREVGFEISINGGDFVKSKGINTKAINISGTKLTSESEFNINGSLIMKESILNNTNLSVNSEIILVPYYVTFDGITVKGERNKYIYKETGFEKTQ